MTERQLFWTVVSALIGAVVFVWYQGWHDKHVQTSHVTLNPQVAQ